MTQHQLKKGQSTVDCTRTEYRTKSESAHSLRSNLHQSPQIVRLSPNTTHRWYMCPFPFFCIGCCLSRTTTLQFYHKKKHLRLTTHCGYCSCYATNIDIPYSQIKSIDYKSQCCILNSKATFVLVLMLSDGQVELTGNLFLSDVVATENYLAKVFERNNIHLHRKVFTNPAALLQYLASNH